MEEKEIWKDVVGWEGMYQVSNIGRVRSLDRIVTRSMNGNKFVKGVLLKLRKDKDGYLTVHIRDTKNNRNRLAKVHRLVADAFIENKDGGNQIDHINGIRDDNRVVNLRYCTCKENNNFPLAQINRSIAITKSYIKNPKLRKIRALNWSKGVVVKKNGIEIRRFSSQHELAQWLGVRDMLISDILNGNKENVFEYSFERI